MTNTFHPFPTSSTQNTVSFFLLKSVTLENVLISLCLTWIKDQIINLLIHGKCFKKHYHTVNAQQLSYCYCYSQAPIKYPLNEREYKTESPNPDIQQLQWDLNHDKVEAT